MEYLPEGGGSHHWVASDADRRPHFLTVDDLDDKDWLGDDREAVFAGLTAALLTAQHLHHEAGLEFVVAPIPDQGGRLLRRLDRRYTLSVFPFLQGHSFAFGPYVDPLLRDRAMTRIIALHQSTDVVRTQAPRHEPRYGGAEALKAIVAEPGGRWIGGPYAEPTRLLLARHTRDIARLAEGFAQLVARTTAERADHVITHGEPHPANLMWSDESLVLIDWDTVALAPAERDLALIAADSGEALHHYQQATGRVVHAPVIALYRLRWYLDDLGSTAEMFQNRHDDTPDTRHWWEGLGPLLDRLPEWQVLLSQALLAAGS